MIAEEYEWIVEAWGSLEGGGTPKGRVGLAVVGEPPPSEFGIKPLR